MTQHKALRLITLSQQESHYLQSLFLSSKTRNRAIRTFQFRRSLVNFYSLLGMTHEEFSEKYEITGLVERRHHDTFPLDLLCYSRKCVHEDVWDKATSLCRGIIITRGQDGGEIVARPFEKFHNY